jgi:hypothetical protein
VLERRDYLFKNSKQFCQIYGVDVRHNTWSIIKLLVAFTGNAVEGDIFGAMDVVDSVDQQNY